MWVWGWAKFIFSRGQRLLTLNIVQSTYHVWYQMKGNLISNIRFPNKYFYNKFAW